MAYRHGVYVSEIPSSVKAPLESDAGVQVIVGVAPINLADDPYSATNVPLLCHTLAEAKSLVGYSSDSRSGLEQTLECSWVSALEKSENESNSKAVTLQNAPLYYTSVDKKPVRTVSGKYYLYDGVAGIEEGQINQLVDPIPYVASAVNVTASSGGTDIESDDSLTERTYLVPSTYSCAGPPDAYEYFAKAWRNDVKDVSVQSPSPCVVDIYFTLQDGTLPSRSDCESMEENMRNDARRPMTDYVNCKAPTEIEYSIDVTYTIARSKSKIAVTVQNAVNEAVEVYKAWQRTMGRDIDPAELIAQIKNAGAKKVKITAPTDVVVDNTEIPKLTTCNVVYGGLEDD